MAEERESIYAMVARIDERTKNMDEKLDQHLDDDKEKHAAFEKRIRRTEDWQLRVGTRFASWGLVIMGAMSFVAAFARDAIAHALGWK